MSGPPRTPELEELVQLLRSATPKESTLAAARAEVLEAATAAGGGLAGTALAARIGYLVLVLLAAGTPSWHATPPRATRSAGTATSAGTSTSAGASTSASEAASTSTSAEEGTRAGTPASASARPSGSASASARPSGSTSASASSATAAPRASRRAEAAGARTSVNGAERASPIAASGPIATLAASDPPRAGAVGAALAAPAVLAAIDPGKQVDGVLPVPVVPADVPPSPTMAEALRDYAAERYAEAAVGFQQVVDGTTADGPDRIAQADFFLAKCLYHLGLYHASAAAFDEVTQRGPAHPYFVASLRWLAMLAERLPEPSGVIESIGRYDESQLAELDDDATREHYHHLLYLLGRARYGERRFSDAIALFARVPDGSRFALEARFFEGIGHVREHRARPALAAFRRVLRAIESGATGGHEDPGRLRDLAWMSIARLYYALAMQPRLPEERASELLSHAIAAWCRIPLRSEHWLDSFHEETWALYVASQYGRALGHVHALESPDLRDRANPEAFVVRAMIFFEHCQWDAVERAIAGFHRRFDGLYADARRAAAMARSNEDAYRMLLGVRSGRSRVPARALPSLRAALGDRELSRHLEHVRSIARERRMLDRIGAPVLDTSLHARVAGDLAVAHALAVDRTGELARARIARFAEELGERMTQMDTVELELATVRREELARPNRLPMGPPDGGPIVAVQGEQIWPFNGEWWRDELPFYVQEVQNRCSR